LKNIVFNNLDCLLVENKFLQLIIPYTVGPRILALITPEKENIFAEIPEITTPLPDGSFYHYYGGHRFWRAPEEIPTTYDLDDQPVEIQENNNTLTIKKKKEDQSNLEKTIKIRLDSDNPTVKITHLLKNCGSQEIKCAAWAITQLKPGGIAILPQTRVKTGLLPNRSLAIWPYTDLSNPAILWGNDYILIHANSQSPLKLGFPNQRGWLAYWISGQLFVKYAAYDPDQTYYDLNSSSECYCGDLFLELETQGPVSFLPPGGTICHEEVWKIFLFEKQPLNEFDVNKMVAALGLDKFDLLANFSRN